MPGKVVFKGYQIGYRICKVEHVKWCDCPYTDLPIQHTLEYLGQLSTYEAAQALLDQLRKDFWAAEAEWRIQECWD